MRRERESGETKLVYHYTKITTLLHIAASSSLLMNARTEMNDPQEAEPRSFDETQLTEDCRSWLRQLNAHRANLRLACFVKDGSFTWPGGDPDAVEELKSCAKGYARPRMWAQYSGASDGACLVFHEDQLVASLREIIEQEQLTGGCGDVQYKEPWERTDLSLKDLKHAVSGGRSASEFAAKSDPYLFVKHDDWRHEREWRIAVFDDSEKRRFLPISHQHVAKVVVGPRFDPAFAPVVQTFVEKFNLEGADKLSWQTGLPDLVPLDLG